MVEIEFVKGDPIAIDGQKLSPAQILTKLNELGGKNGIGRLDLVENRYVGMKSRGCYETPGGTIMLRAHRAIESITLDREVAHLKDDLMPRYASLIYNGYWWAPERVALQTLIDHTQQSVNGWVRIKLYKGNVIVVSRDSKTNSLFDMTIATFDEDGGARGRARCVARHRRIADVAARRIVAMLIRKGSLQHQKLLASGMLMLREAGFRCVTNNRCGASHLFANSVKHLPLHASDR
jgi:argininosuccinate synthase